MQINVCTEKDKIQIACKTEMMVTEKFIEISHMTPNSVIEFGFRPKEDGQPVSFALIVGGMASTTNCSKFSLKVFSLKSGELIGMTCNTAVSIMQFDPNIQGYRFYITGDEALSGGTIEIQPDKGTHEAKQSSSL
ncbi:hypothetical protein CHS0354_016251 [Potamilus streckersoni]|uniref:Nucleoplasmin-like domain-containing protein n=1 Tax=Potamilus streckersoni TaxID=2493646 RepID=A0AAE0RXC0_9BIVA|nr:hypothetical protein CHS0354_016251 [Potamilus streckersoni]